MKASAIELELHAAITNEEDIALSRLYNLYGDPIIRILKHRFHSAAKRDEALIFEAVNEAFLGYSNNPGTFNPERYTLFIFLLIAARRDLQNILQKGRKHLNRKDLPENVELQEKLWNSIIEPHSSTDDTIQMNEAMTAIQNLLESFFQNERDIALAWMVIARERETELCSEILEINNLSIPEQRIEVKKHKDRIKKVLERNDVENRIKSLLR